MTTERGTTIRTTWRGVVVLMGCFAALCTIFAFVVTVLEAWQEHAQAQWPEVTARIQKCVVSVSRKSRQRASENQGGYYYIDCHITYLIGAEEIATRVLSRSAPAPNVLARNNPWALVDQLQSLGGRTSPGDTDRGPLQSHQPPEGRPGQYGHAARRAPHTKQHEATGNLRGDLRGPAGHR